VALTSLPQCWHCAAGTWRWRVGLGWSGRCAPACGLPPAFAGAGSLGLVVDARDALCPCEGGVLELSGVFGGKSSLARRLAFSARSAAFCASNTVSRLLSSSIRASNDAINASFSALDRQEESGGGVTHTLTHILPPDAIAFRPIESICRTNNAGQTRGLSNYLGYKSDARNISVVNHSCAGNIESGRPKKNSALPLSRPPTAPHRNTPSRCYCPR